MPSGQENADERALYMISVAAELAGIHPQTLRDYERRGLLEPVRSVGNTRRYSPHDVDRIRRIVELTRAGVSLEGVRLVLDLEARISDMQLQMEDALRELDHIREQAREDMERLRRSYRRELVPFTPNLPAVRTDPRSGGAH